MISFDLGNRQLFRTDNSYHYSTEPKAPFEAYVPSYEPPRRCVARPGAIESALKFAQTELYLRTWPTESGDLVGAATSSSKYEIHTPVNVDVPYMIPIPKTHTPKLLATWEDQPEDTPNSVNPNLVYLSFVITCFIFGSTAPSSAAGKYNVPPMSTPESAATKPF